MGERRRGHGSISIQNEIPLMCARGTSVHQTSLSQARLMYWGTPRHFSFSCNRGTFFRHKEMSTMIFRGREKRTCVIVLLHSGPPLLGETIVDPGRWFRLWRRLSRVSLSLVQNYSNKLGTEVGMDLRRDLKGPYTRYLIKTDSIGPKIVDDNVL